MIPGMNPRMMKQAMKKMGIAQEEIDALRVIIETPQNNIIIENPSVMKVNMSGQETFQISGSTHEEEKSATPDINDDDIETVMEQAGVTEEQARKAIEEAKGDLAEAIMNLKD